MPLLGAAAMLLTFDVDADVIDEHDDWHTHEHLPERLSIPGFLRGTRWVAVEGAPRYVVLYEVERLETLASDAYLTRLDHPTPWTASMMTRYRGMTRGLCVVARSFGVGMGHCALLLRFKPAAGAEAALDAWLGARVMPALPARRGLSGVHLLKTGLAARMTSEQRIRGADAGVDWALLALGYEPKAVAELAASELSPAALVARGASGATAAQYRSAYTLTAGDLAG